MPQSSTYTRRKGTDSPVTTIVEFSLLSIAGKILARVLLNRLQKHLEEGLLPESQCGFRKGRGTVYRYDLCCKTTARKMSGAKPGSLHYFRRIWQRLLTPSAAMDWKIMAKFGCPEKFIAMVRQFHDGMQASVQDNGEHSSSFPVTNGVKQGCVLASNPVQHGIFYHAQ